MRATSIWQSTWRIVVLLIVSEILYRRHGICCAMTRNVAGRNHQRQQQQQLRPEPSTIVVLANASDLQLFVHRHLGIRSDDDDDSNDSHNKNVSLPSFASASSLVLILFASTHSGMGQRAAEVLQGLAQQKQQQQPPDLSYSGDKATALLPRLALARVDCALCEQHLCQKHNVTASPTWRWYRRRLNSYSDNDNNNNKHSESSRNHPIIHDAAALRVENNLPSSWATELEIVDQYGMPTVESLILNAQFYLGWAVAVDMDRTPSGYDVATMAAAGFQVDNSAVMGGSDALFEFIMEHHLQDHAINSNKKIKNPTHSFHHPLLRQQQHQHQEYHSAL